MPRLLLDISALPSDTQDHRSPIWWGNLLLLAIESTMFALLLASYFYIWQNFGEWPPPRSDRTPILYDPVPDLPAATTTLALLLASLFPMVWTSRECLKLHTTQVRAGMFLIVLIGAAALVLEFQCLKDLHFKWSDNAYASIVWTLVGLHIIHVIVATAENLLMLVWVVIKGLDHKHGRDIRVASVYWYWVVAIWAILYAVVFWMPRLVDNGSQS
jgi:cytochrome c oxidase subunit III